MMLREKLPAVNDKAGDAVPRALPTVIDAHVHVFPEGIFRSIWKWFDEYGWPIRYKLRSPEALAGLLAKGVRHIVALQYAHKPGIAHELNQYMVMLCDQFPGKITGMATVFPGEENATDILRSAFAAGLKGVKLHAHVQCFDMNSKQMDVLYDLCATEQKPMVMHAGREPKSPGYKCDPYLICRADKLERVIKDHPGLKVCVPHLGMDEFTAYHQLLWKYDTLWTDTTMALTGYLPGKKPVPLNEMRLDRVMYGSDYPNIPFAWDRELNWIGKMGLNEAQLEQLLNKSAASFFNIDV